LNSTLARAKRRSEINSSASIQGQPKFRVIFRH
jgi:hypothetical protein